MTDLRGSILLVDDEEKILKALGRALRDAGHGVVETTSPRHAQRLLAERAFDLMVVDNVMPELNGLDLIRKVAALSKAIGTVLTSEFKEGISKEDRRDDRITGLLFKPYQPEQLVQLVARVAQVTQMRRELRKVSEDLRR